MARRNNLARVKIGYVLTIQQEHGPEAGEWKKVGFVEVSKDLCRAYKDREYPSIKNFTITAVRADLRPVEIERGNNQERR
jgi:hypothetical protein